MVSTQTGIFGGFMVLIGALLELTSIILFSLESIGFTLFGKIICLAGILMMLGVLAPLSTKKEYTPKSSMGLVIAHFLIGFAILMFGGILAEFEAEEVQTLGELIAAIIFLALGLIFVGIIGLVAIIFLLIFTIKYFGELEKPQFGTVIVLLVILSIILLPLKLILEFGIMFTIWQIILGIGYITTLRRLPYSSDLTSSGK